MCLRQFGNRVLPFPKCSAACVLGCSNFGGKDHSTNDTDTLTRKRERLFVIYAMPAGTRNDSNPSLDRRLVKVAHEVLPNAACGYLKSAAGQAGTKRSSITMQVLIRDGVLMNHPVIVFPLQLASPTMTLRVANATYDLERGGQPKMFFPFFISTPFFNRL